MSNLDLYYLPFSAPCRTVQMVADVLGINLTLKKVDLMAGEHLKPEYLKINSHHTVPTLVDNSNNLALNESRAMIRYICNKFSPNSSLYPADLAKRALVDQALDFDGSALYPTLVAIVYPVIRFNTPLNKGSLKFLDDKLALLDNDLSKHHYIAGDELTIADLSLLSTWSSIIAVGLWNTEQYKNIHSWVQRIKDSGKIKNYNELVVETAKTYGDWVKAKIASTN